MSSFLIIDSTDRSKISSDQHLIFFDVGLYPLSFFANTPFNEEKVKTTCKVLDTGNINWLKIIEIGLNDLSLFYLLYDKETLF